jgi:hypothetical protein
MSAIGLPLVRATSLRVSSLRKQGPITTGVRGYERPLPPRPNESTRRMGPRFRGDDELRLVARQNKLSWPGAFLHLAPFAAGESHMEKGSAILPIAYGVSRMEVTTVPASILVCSPFDSIEPHVLHVATFDQAVDAAAEIPYAIALPFAGRGRRRRAAASPGEGDSPRVLPCRESPSPQPSKSELRSSRPRKRDEGARRASHSTVIARLDRATQYAAASHSSCRGARATREPGISRNKFTPLRDSGSVRTSDLPE